MMIETMQTPLTTRRDVLRAGSLGLFGLSLPQLLERRALAAAQADDFGPRFGQAKACILLFMWGGPAHQDTWDLKPEAPPEVRGEFRPIATKVPGLDICEHFPRLSTRTDKLAVIRSMTHGNVDHTTSTHYLLTGQPPPQTSDLRKDWPHVGSVLSRLGWGRAPLPPFVSMRPKLENDVPRFVEESHGQFAGWLGPNFDPLTIDADPSRDDYRVGDFELLTDVPSTRLDERQALLTALDEGPAVSRSQPALVMDNHYARAFDLLNSAIGADAFDVSREPDDMRDRYGRNPHGQSVLQARRLVERGVPLVTVFWPNDGIKNVSVYWDTHSRNFVDLKNRLMPPADVAFSRCWTTCRSGPAGRDARRLDGRVRPHAEGGPEEQRRRSRRRRPRSLAELLHVRAGRGRRARRNGVRDIRPARRVSHGECGAAGRPDGDGASPARHPAASRPGGCHRPAAGDLSGRVRARPAVTLRGG